MADVIDSGGLDEQAGPERFKDMGDGTFAPVVDTVQQNAPVVDAGGEGDVSVGGQFATAVAAGKTGSTVVKASAGRLGRVLVTAVGAGAATFFDNASATSGTIIGYVPASAALGVVIDFQMPAAAGITMAGGATNPGLTVSWS